MASDGYCASDVDNAIKNCHVMMTKQLKLDMFDMTKQDERRVALDQ
jgi:hypothetical protein